MPPAKRVLQEDSTPTLKEKLNALHNPLRGRRNGANALVNGSSLKEVVSQADTASTNGGGALNGQSTVSSAQFPPHPTPQLCVFATLI
jgi:hypothetical protein